MTENTRYEGFRSCLWELEDKLDRFIQMLLHETGIQGKNQL